LGTKIDGERGQVSSLIEIHYAIGAISGASSSNPPRITDGDVVVSPTESSEVLSSLGDAALESSVSNFEVVKRSRSSAESSHSSFTLIEADSEVPEPESESFMLIRSPTGWSIYYIPYLLYHRQQAEFGVNPADQAVYYFQQNIAILAQISQ
jgi:hypothetical protein